MFTELLKQYGFRECLLEDLILCTVSVMKAEINNCSITVTESWDNYQKKTTRLDFHLLEINGVRLSNLSEELLTICDNIFRSIDPYHFDIDDSKRVAIEESLDKFMEDLGAVTAFLSAIVT